MKMSFGQPYRGFGAADPALSRQDRRRQLEVMIRGSCETREIVTRLYLEYYDGLQGRMAPLGPMLDAILAHEYPKG